MLSPLSSEKCCTFCSRCDDTEHTEESSHVAICKEIKTAELTSSLQYFKANIQEIKCVCVWEGGCSGD